MAVYFFSFGIYGRMGGWDLDALFCVRSDIRDVLPAHLLVMIPRLSVFFFFFSLTKLTKRHCRQKDLPWIWGNRKVPESLKRQLRFSTPGFRHKFALSPSPSFSVSALQFSHHVGSYKDS
ncbi:unnamed protein product, partial [Tuber aestivum]